MSRDGIMAAGYRDALLRLIRRRVRDASLSEDIVQDAYLRYLGRSGPPAEEGWALIRTIALNLIRDHFRAGARRSFEPIDEEHPADGHTPESAVMLRERVEWFSRAVEAMPPLQRDVFIRRRLHGQSAKEAAAELGLTPAAVDQHVARALVALQKAQARGGRR